MKSLLAIIFSLTLSTTCSAAVLREFVVFSGNVESKEWVMALDTQGNPMRVLIINGIAPRYDDYRNENGDIYRYFDYNKGTQFPSGSKLFYSKNAVLSPNLPFESKKLILSPPVSSPSKEMLRLEKKKPSEINKQQ